MVKHIVILGSSYKTGNRIALDFSYDKCKHDELISILNDIKKSGNKKYSIATHTITTKTNKWSDVVNLDPFFKNVKLLDSKDKFLHYLKDDEETSALDIANYISTYYNCTHTRLEKLVYYCYADYLCKYKEKLFNDAIYAFKYGPVISTIYEIYKNSDKSDFIKPIPNEYDMSIRSRILNSVNGLNKIKSIEETLDKYKYYNTATLISLTHQDNTPWAYSDKGTSAYKIISDSVILKYHKYETV